MMTPTLTVTAPVSTPFSAFAPADSVDVLLSSSFVDQWVSGSKMSILSFWGESSRKAPGQPLRKFLNGATYAPTAERLARLNQMSKRIIDPDYTLKNFYDDVTFTFPELGLYLASTESDKAGRASAGRTSSGNTSSEEYLRTLGAMFAVYWLLRLDLPAKMGSTASDGQRGFCFGVDESWQPPKPDMVDKESLEAAAAAGSDLSNLAKRSTFLSTMSWESAHELALFFGYLRASRLRARG